MTKDYEMLFLQAKEKQFLDLLENQRYYEIFELPFIIQQILKQIREVQIDTSGKLSNLRTTKGDDISSHST